MSFEKEDIPWVLGGLAALIGIIVLAGPYVLVYGVSVVGIGVGLGYLWLRACYRGEADRRYGRLALLIPLSMGLAWIALESASPRRMAGDSLGQGGQSLVRAHAKRGHAKEESDGLVVDVWNERFNELYAGWYGAIFGKVHSRASFNYEHLRFLVWLAVGVGAPLVFGLFYRKDFEEYQYGLKREAYATESERKKDYAAKQRDIEQAWMQIKRDRHEMDETLKLAKKEIDRLREREKYLTEGKPKPLEATPQKPDLDIF